MTVQNEQRIPPGNARIHRRGNEPGPRPGPPGSQYAQSWRNRERAYREARVLWENAGGNRNEAFYRLERPRTDDEADRLRRAPRGLRGPRQSGKAGRRDAWLQWRRQIRRPYGLFWLYDRPLRQSNCERQIHARGQGIQAGDKRWDQPSARGS